MFLFLIMISILQQGAPAGIGPSMIVTEDGELIITMEDGESITIES